MDDQKPKSLDEWIKHWDERIKLAQLAVTGKTHLSILVGILPGILPFIVLILLFLSDAVSFVLGCLLFGTGYAVAIATILLLYHLWAKPNKKLVIQQLLDEIQHTCDAQGLSKAKVAEELAARSPAGSVRETVIAGLDPEKAVMLKPERTTMLKKDTDYPWLTGKGPGVGSKFLGIMASAIFFGIMLLSAIVLLFNEFAVNTPTTLPVVGLVLGAVGWLIALLYAYTTSFDFRPGRRVPSDVLGQPFEARFSRPFASRGTMQFDRDRLLLQATRRPPSLGYGEGEGLLEILLIGLLTWIINSLLRTTGKEFFVSIAYSSIQSFSVTGRGVEISHSGGEPRRLRLKVASSDGARLYRELYHHYPLAISDWEDELRDIFGARLDLSSIPLCDPKASTASNSLRDSRPQKGIQEMATITCPKCGTENSSDAMNCRQCRINLQFALENPEEF